MDERKLMLMPDYRVRQRDFLLQISHAITAQLELSDVLRLVLRASTAMLIGQVGVVALRDDTDGLFYVRAVSGVNRERIPELDELFRSLLENVDRDFNYEHLNSRLREIARAIDEELREAVAIPLIFAHDPLGLLVIFRSYRTNFTPDDLQILQSFATQAAIAVHNAQLYRRIDQERQRLAAILEHSGDGVMILDADLTILQINKSFELISGWQAEDAIGLHQHDVVSWERSSGHDVEQALLDGWPYIVDPDQPAANLYVEGDLVRRDGLQVGIGITYAPLLNKEGKISNIIANVRDITNFRKAQDMQNIFISTVSHELRTPIALIKGYASTLGRDDVDWDSPVVRQYAGIIEDESDRLNELVEDLLTTSKIQAERHVRLNIGDVWLDRIAMRSVERFSTQLKSHKIHLDFPEQLPVVSGDEMLLRQVLDNLISNAIKYSPKGGLIEVGGSFDDESVKLYVKDSGVGIPVSEQGHIFDRFYRVDGNLSRKTSGAGLGLYLAKTIVQAHNGQLWVESQPGKGATFIFMIPRS